MPWMMHAPTAATALRVRECLMVRDLSFFCDRSTYAMPKLFLSSFLSFLDGTPFSFLLPLTHLHVLFSSSIVLDVRAYVTIVLISVRDLIVARYHIERFDFYPQNFREEGVKDERGYLLNR